MCFGEPCLVCRGKRSDARLRLKAARDCVHRAPQSFSPTAPPNPSDHRFRCAFWFKLRTMEGHARSSRSQSTSSHVSSASSVHSLYDPHEPPRTEAAPFTGEPGDDPALLHDAISALRIMRSGSTGGGPLDSSSQSSSAAHHHRPGQSRSPSTVSTTSCLWDGSGLSSSTGASSPVGPASVPPDVDSREHDFSDGDPNFIARVSQLPLVSGSLEWYERSKKSSRIVGVSPPPALPA